MVAQAVPVAAAHRLAAVLAAVLRAKAATAVKRLFLSTAQAAAVALQQQVARVQTIKAARAETATRQRFLAHPSPMRVAGADRLHLPVLAAQVAAARVAQPEQEPQEPRTQVAVAVVHSQLAARLVQPAALAS